MSFVRVSDAAPDNDTESAYVSSRRRRARLPTSSHPLPMTADASWRSRTCPLVPRHATSPPAARWAGPRRRAPLVTMVCAAKRRNLWSIVTTAKCMAT